MDGNTPRIDVAPDDLRTLKAFVTLPPEAAEKIEDGRVPFSFVVRDRADGTETSRATAFRGPDK
jgi:hypothetical protein